MKAAISIKFAKLFSQKESPSQHEYRYNQIFSIQNQQSLRKELLRIVEGREDMVTIIIPVLNEEKTIEKCLQNIIELPGQKELIVVDGGSP